MCTFPRESLDLAGVAVLFASRYIYMYTHMYITHIFLHVYKSVLHTSSRSFALLLLPVPSCSFQHLRHTGGGHDADTQGMDKDAHRGM